MKNPPPSSSAAVLAAINKLVKSASDVPADPTLSQTNATAPTQPEANDPAKLRIPAGTRPTNAEGNVPDAPATQEPTALADATPPAPASVGSPVQPASLEKRANDLLTFLNKTAGAIQASVTPTAPAAAPAAPAATAPLQKDAAQEAALAAVEGEDLGEMMKKIGSALWNHEEGREFIERVCKEQVGAAAAQQLVAQTNTLVKRASAEAAQQELLIKRAYEQQLHQEAVLNHELRLLQATDPQGYAGLQKLASSQEDVMIKIAGALSADPEFAQLNAEEQQFTMAMYGEMVKQGSADMAAMLEAGGPEGTEEIPEMPGAEGEAGPEEIIQLIEQLVASGQLTEEQAAQIVAQLTEGAGAAAEGAPPEGGEGGAPAAAGDPAAAAEGAGLPPEMMKMAGAPLSADLLEALSFIPDTLPA